MGCLRGVTALLDWPLILAAALALLVPSTSAQTCVSAFQSTADTIQGFDDTVEIDTTLGETTASGTELYTLSWDSDCVDPPQIIDDQFNKYFTVNDTEDCTWVVSVNSDLTGVPDYPSPTDTIETTVTFQGFTAISYATCSVTLKHTISDENTQTPEPELPIYTLTIKEDLNTGYTIAGFNTSVQDKDGSSPNNQFSVSVDDNCPLEATRINYTSGQDARAVEYQLRETVDYETTPAITCTVTFEDQGTPPNSDSATININISDENDEPPVFTFNYYYSDVSSVVVPGEALVINPSSISASDGDTGIMAAITYTMTDANPDVNGLDYFEIKGNTGEVALKKDLDDDFLLNERVVFFVQASDGSLTAPAILDVTLPPVPTTTASTTPATTCEPCPTTTTTTHPTVTWDPDLPPLTFKKESYVADIYSSFTTLFAVEVEDIEGYEVTYSLRGTGSEFFSIDANSGMISVNQDNQPPVDFYEMEAEATVTSVPSETATTKVTINVLPMSLEEVAIMNSIITATVPEGDGEQDLGNITLSDTADIVCVTAADPPDLKDRFTTEKESDTVWKLKKSGALDYEETKEITLSIRAYTGEAPENCESISGDIPVDFLKSEALAIITVTDINDEEPAFSSDVLVAALPTNEGLKRVVGPVVSVHADDKDTAVVTYSLTGQDAAQFTVDEVAGDVYGVEGLSCDPECVFSVTASDGRNEDQVSVTVLPLGTDQVSTILMTNTALSEVDEKLEQISDAAGVQISMLYVSPTETTARRGSTRYRRDTTTSLRVNVYSIRDGALMSRDELNSALSDSSSQLQAAEFIDAGVFEGNETEDTTGLKVAVGVLGGLLGIVLIAGVAFFVYQKRRGKAAPKQNKPPTPISTLGQAYHNPSYTAESSRNQVNLGSGSVGHKSNGSLNGYTGGGSLNGYTSAEIHRQPEQESPPLHRSPLAQPTDSIPLRTRDSQQQGGLKRTVTGAPEYYGSSSPAPPPSYSSTSSPSYPIYAEIKKPRDPSTSAHKNNRDTSNDEDDLGDIKFASVRRSPPPRRSIKPDDEDDGDLGNTNFSSVRHSPPPRRSTKPDDEDDGDLGNTNFSSVRHSPPPRRSTKPDSEDDDEDDDVAYPGGRHAGFRDEPAEEEKKSVAFKVKVETKEIEAEYMGPAQKKAEATKLMEANRKKIQEEGDDEDDDDEEEEESMKL